MKIYYFLILNYNLIAVSHDILVICLILSLVFGLLTIINKNPIYSVLLLICLFVSTSIYLISIGSSYLGISYILVYIGAISILFLFTLMLVNIRLSELLSDNNKYLLLSIVIIFNTIMTIHKTIYFLRYNTIDDISETNMDKFIISNWDNIIITMDSINIIGNSFYTEFSIWFIIISLILLLAMVGAIILTKK